MSEEAKYREIELVLVDALGVTGCLESKLSIIDKILLWNPCNPWEPVPRVTAPSVVYAMIVKTFDHLVGGES